MPPAKTAEIERYPRIRASDLPASRPNAIRLPGCSAPHDQAARDQRDDAHLNGTDKQRPNGSDNPGDSGQYRRPAFHAEIPYRHSQHKAEENTCRRSLQGVLSFGSTGSTEALIISSLSVLKSVTPVQIHGQAFQFLDSFSTAL